MFGRLKKLFKKHVEEEPLAEPAESGFPPREFQPGYTPGMAPPAAPSEERSSSPRAVAEEAEARAQEPVTGDSIRIFLKPILLKLPDLLKARVRQPPGGPIQISLPLEKILAQHSLGSVRISFGELRQASPAGVFADQSDQDQIAVELPLPDILAQLGPDQLPRRAAQKKVEVPDDVGGIFGATGAPLDSVRMSATPAKAAPASVAPPPEMAPKYVPAPDP